jgi:fused signal recognition particle receptor
VFKRLRDNLFGRAIELPTSEPEDVPQPEEQEAPLEASQAAAEQTHERAASADVAPQSASTPRPDAPSSAQGSLAQPTPSVSPAAAGEVSTTPEPTGPASRLNGSPVQPPAASTRPAHTPTAASTDSRGAHAASTPVPTLNHAVTHSAPTPPQWVDPQTPESVEAARETQASGGQSDARADSEQSTGQRGFTNPFRFSLGRTRALFGRVNEALRADDITDDLWDELEETLISADVGVTTTERLLATLRERARMEALRRGSQLRDALKEELELLVGDPESLVFSDTSALTVLLIVGVNGVGKTTSIAKLSNLLKRQKHQVLLAAGDTFRAAATEQLKLWGERVGVPVISHQYGADPAAVVYDAVQAAQARKSDVLIVDTAGRLHTKFNLMEELKKIVRVLQKYDPEAPHEVLLVMDATTGQNGYLQAKQFIADAGVSGVILTKLDGTARGGIVFAIASELGLPIKYVGTGEQLGDIAPFDAIEFVDALFDTAES